MNQATIEFKNYFLSAAGAAGAAASAGLASAAGAAAGAAGASAAGAAAGAGAAGAAASSFLPQAANAAAAMMAAKTRDLFMMIFLNRGIKTISGNCQRSLQCAYKTAATERKHSSSFISACDYRGFHAPFQRDCFFVIHLIAKTPLRGASSRHHTNQTATPKRGMKTD